MISGYPAYQVGLERIDGLRRKAEAWRSAKLAQAGSGPSPSMTRGEQPLQPNHDQATSALAA